MPCPDHLLDGRTVLDVDPDSDNSDDPDHHPHGHPDTMLRDDHDRLDVSFRSYWYGLHMKQLYRHRPDHESRDRGHVDEPGGSRATRDTSHPPLQVHRDV